MDAEQTTPILNGHGKNELPIRPIQSPYFILRTAIGGYYVDSQYNANLVRKPVELLSRFLAGAQRVPDSNGGGEIRYEARPNQRPLRYLHEGAIQEFEAAARSFYNGAASADQASLRKGFRLPDPVKEPDAYWVWGDRFNPQLMVLWGCEREEHSSLPLVGGERSVISVLRAQAMSWMRLFREAIEFCKDNDSLAEVLVFPVLNEKGELTHIQRLVNGKYVLQEVRRRPYEFWKVRPLKAVPARSIHEFRRLAEAFYQKAHPNGCACGACRAANAGQPAPVSAGSRSAPSYEQELRKGFRLPDPERRPDAYLVVGPPFAGRILVLCPHPAVKDPEEVEEVARRVQSLAAAGNKALAEELAVQQQQDSAQQELYNPYFYSSDECICLTEDKVLGLPASAAPKKGKAQPTPVPLPTDPGAVPGEPDPSAATVVARLWKRRINWRWLLLLWSAVLGGGLLAWLIYTMLAPSQLRIAAAEVSNSPQLDPGNHRNVLVVQFNNQMSGGLMSRLFGHKLPPNARGRYTLQAGGKDYKLLPPVPLGNKAVVLTMETPGTSFEESAQYQLTAEQVTDVWGNHLRLATMPLNYIDKRPPGLARILPAGDDADNRLQLEFDEPIERSSATAAANYSIPGMAIASADLQADGQTVILKTEKPFDAGASYTLCLRNIADASQNRNRMADTTNEFNYAQLALKVNRLSADEAQTRIKLLFNRGIDRQSVQALPTFRLDNLQIGAVTLIDRRSAELVLTNSFLKPNVPYTLHITKLKDDSGRAGSVLTTNLSFQYTGPVDATPPSIRDVSLSRPNTLELAFDKDVRKDVAEKEANYRLLVVTAGSQSSDGLTLRFRPQAVSSRVVALNLSESLPYGSFRLLYPGIQDLAGNSTGTNAFFDFKNQGLAYQTKQCSDISLSSDRTQLNFKLQFRLDKSGADPRNFRIEATDDFEVTAVEMNPGPNTTEVILKLDRPVGPANFNVRYTNLRLEGDVSPQSGIVKPSR